MGYSAAPHRHTRKRLQRVPGFDTRHLLRNRVDVIDFQSRTRSTRTTHHVAATIEDYDGRIAEHLANCLEHFPLRRLSHGDHQSQGSDTEHAAQHHETGTQLVAAHHSQAVANQTRGAHIASCRALFGSATRSSVTIEPRSMRAIRWQWFAMS